jgi:hypothetical protein
MIRTEPAGPKDLDVLDVERHVTAIPEFCIVARR